jgi:hypothetical protein
MGHDKECEGLLKIETALLDAKRETIGLVDEV